MGSNLKALKTNLHILNTQIKREIINTLKKRPAKNFGTRDHINQRIELRHSFLCDSRNELTASLKLCKQSTLGLPKVEHGRTKREATHLFLQNSK